MEYKSQKKRLLNRTLHGKQKSKKGDCVLLFNPPLEGKRGEHNPPIK